MIITIMEREIMIVKKNFSIMDYKEEAIFLNEMASKGFVFKKFMGDSYEFTETDSCVSDYRIEYSVEPLELEEYTMFEVIDTYHSSKGGYYTYLLRTGKGEVISNDDRLNVIELQKSRTDRFASFVLLGLLFLFTYLFMQNKDIIYLVIIFAALILGLYVFRVSIRMKQIINELNNNNVKL